MPEAKIEAAGIDSQGTQSHLGKEVKLLWVVYSLFIGWKKNHPGRGD